MKILDTRVYRGPNLYALRKVIRLRVDLGELEDYPDRPAARVRRPSAGADPDAPRAHLLLRRAGRLRAPHDRGRGDLARPRAGARRHRAAVPRRHAGHLRQDAQPRPARAGSTTSSTASRRRRSAWRRRSWGCGSSATCCRPSARRTTRSPFDFQAELEDFVRLAQRRAFGPSTASLVRAAEERDIPWIRLNDRSLVQLGHGRYQRRIQATVTSETRHIAVEIASDKRLTNQILSDLGLPVPRQMRVRGPERRRRGRRAHRLSRWWSSRSTATTAGASRST